MYMYIWRSLFEGLGIYSLSYVISILLVGVNVVSSLLRKYKGMRQNIFLDMYIVFAIIGFIVSIFSRGFVVSLMGIAAVLLNLMIWKYSKILAVDTKSDVLNLFCRYFMFAMIINAIAGIYQYFVDPSVFGLVTGIFGDESIMSASNVTRRAVGFMGTPQVYSASCGVALFVAENIKNPKRRVIIQILLLVSGLLSGSRAFGVFAILFVLYITVKMSPVKRAFCVIGACVVLAVALLYVGDQLSEIDTLFRNFDFTRWAASKVYFSSFNEFKWHEFLLGKGYGLEGWSNNLSDISFDYSATESCLISIVYQLGIIAAFIFIFAFIVVFFRAKNNRVGRFLVVGIFINLCCTPAFAGFAFSYLAWPIILMINNNFKFK